MDLRAFCRQNKIAYQSFWTLTANPDLLAGPCASVAKELSATPEQVSRCTCFVSGRAAVNAVTWSAFRERSSLGRLLLDFNLSLATLCACRFSFASCRCAA